MQLRRIVDEVIALYRKDGKALPGPGGHMPIAQNPLDVRLTVVVGCAVARKVHSVRWGWGVAADQRAVRQARSQSRWSSCSPLIA